MSFGCGNFCDFSFRHTEEEKRYVNMNNNNIIFHMFFYQKLVTVSLKMLQKIIAMYLQLGDAIS